MPLFKNRQSYTAVQVRKKDIPGGLWMKCKGCAEIIFKQEVEQNLHVCPKCGHHFRMPRRERISMLAEPDSFHEYDAGMTSVDSLQFTGTASYEDKLETNIAKTGEQEAVTCGEARVGNHEVGLGVMDFAFLGASMGSVVGEKATRMFERSTQQGRPILMICTSGGARMYEGMLSLMQMAKTSAALERHAEAGLAYIPVLTHPTTAGVMASFASLGDVILAEPEALIGFAGPRVIKETTQQDLPEGFQRAEFLLDHGLIDRVVPRPELKSTLVQLLDYFDR
ncbi:acetyl-CoA carboxylase, carboxyltransferase subunit beta [Kiritimatiella glycovorans]|uniref:Acetyl-coenzyme A carboxylase carboxyl transferase subunit beta n=1 Tax=Kiritimatiella glycovorans TaxID=1307763 RepID=A0A0G3EJS7_9BACT|nr:acetyl-CoA carboxylase, carboxyltransferase subunit beta [Kiritimatiella glycovorans]AKJ64379.1 Acetyl-coenzyme A carboxylase carboxyl transferase subunit beta [Kiritimatiella glycovorans]